MLLYLIIFFIKENFRVNIIAGVPLPPPFAPPLPAPLPWPLPNYYFFDVLFIFIVDCLCPWACIYVL